jgi:hypothetical protein
MSCSAIGLERNAPELVKRAKWGVAEQDVKDT